MFKKMLTIDYYSSEQAREIISKIKSRRGEYQNATGYWHIISEVGDKGTIEYEVKSDTYF